MYDDCRIALELNFSQEGFFKKKIISQSVMNIPYLLQVAEVCKAGILFPSNVQPISGFLHLRLKVLNQKLHHRVHFSALVKHKKGKVTKTWL